ncbi:MAG: UTP--glucose-1-phosphate uridylyltransferase, variant 3 [Marteilia pararefringens]
MRRVSLEDKVLRFEEKLDELAQRVEEFEGCSNSCGDLPSSDPGIEFPITIGSNNFSSRTNGFKQLYRQMIFKKSNIETLLESSSINASSTIDCTAHLVRDWEQPSPGLSESRIRDLLSLVVPIKLSGGLGTSMKCSYPKAFVDINESQCLIETSIKQIRYYNSNYGCKMPLVLMTSFNTDHQMREFAEQFGGKLRIEFFEQNAMPRIRDEGHVLLPLVDASRLTKNGIKKNDWYPPGHGEFYETFHSSGLLDLFIEEGKEWAFVSNIDNFGATPDPKLIAKLQEMKDNENVNFVAEVTKKTLNDVKGGIFIKDSQNNCLRLIESTQMPEDKKERFTLNSNCFEYFNTNNVWINLRQMKRLIESGSIETDVIINRKTLAEGIRIIQLESAIGSAIKSFKDSSRCFEVSRNRFLPIKKCDDLFYFKTKLIECDQNGFLTRPILQLPSVKLGKKFVGVMYYNFRTSGSFSP